MLSNPTVRKRRQQAQSLPETLVDLAQEFEALENALQTLELWPLDTPEDIADYEMHVYHLMDRQMAMVRKAITIEATGKRSLKAKARIAITLLEHFGRQIDGEIALSLCEDILRIR